MSVKIKRKRTKGWKMSVCINLVVVKRTHPQLLEEMTRHYSKPKGFVGRNICYAIVADGHCYGHIVAGSAVRFLRGRDDFLGMDSLKNLNNLTNNIFYHVEPKNGKYPMRNFTTAILKEFEKKVIVDWKHKYGDSLVALESLVEPPRTGEVYRRAGWAKIGKTLGFTCKRVAGKGTDSWTGKRVWDTKNLRPKFIFVKRIDCPIPGCSAALRFPNLPHPIRAKAGV